MAIKDIFGRDQFIADLWRVLDQNSVRMEAERRIGKTHILSKMAAEPPKGWEVISFDLQKVHSAAEFAELVCREVHQRLTGWKRQGKRIWDVLGLAGGVQAGPIKFPDKKSHPDGYWKKLLTGAVEDLVEQQHDAGKRVVFFFDEMPWMISAIADPERDGPQTAMEVLDVLRSLRQSRITGPGFRMVLCGSVGMHHVLGTLKSVGYKNQPVNDAHLQEVPELDPALAEDLTARLFAGEGMTCDAGVPGLVAERTGGFPYYIHWVVSELRKAGPHATAADVDRVIQILLTADHDPCQLRHFLERIDTYYPKDKPAILALLDHAARTPASLDLAELINVAKSGATVDDERSRELVRLLAVDHYLTRGTDSRYSFRHPLLRRWWVLERGIHS